MSVHVDSRCEMGAQGGRVCREPVCKGWLPRCLRILLAQDRAQ